MTKYPRTARAVLACLPLAICLAFASGAGAATTFYITGGGNGHGIGMSQYGAYGYAQHGWSYRHILGHYYQGTGIRTTNPDQIIRVLLADGSPSFSGASSATAPRAGDRSVRLSASQTYSMKALPGGYVALYDHSGRQLASVRPPLIARGPGPVDLAGHGRYRGSLEFRWSLGLRVQTVNALDLEDYVRGVVSGEMPASWSTQALQAQAVAARTYAITTTVHGNGYRLYSDTRSQMYRGVSAETSSTDAAVAATRGQVVTLNGKPVVTYYFASSGGHTESVQNVWLGSAPEPWLRGMPDPHDSAGGNPYYRWKVSMSMASAAARLGSAVKGTFKGITVLRRGVSPRVVTASVIGTAGTTSVTGPQLQGDFGLMSTYMSFSAISTSAGAAVSQTSTARAIASVAAGQAPPLSLHGSVSPAPPGAVVDVQRLVGGRWTTTLSRVGLKTGGSYSVSLPGAGRYRVVYRGLDGPAVSVG